jgi:hypothetical protein
MYWDIIEVKPEADYRLFVRFKDGLSGFVQLRREELTGALAPQDVQFFERVFIDGGAVAWPGEIDLAPDAMYSQVAGESRQTQKVVAGETELQRYLPRFYELKDLLIDPSHPDAYFHRFEDVLRTQNCFCDFRYVGKRSSKHRCSRLGISQGQSISLFEPKCERP